MLIDGEKWACEACVRGHRVSNCQHYDRPLQHINKKGRPVTQCQHCRSQRKNRSAHVKCDCGEKTTKCIHLGGLEGHRESCCCNHGGRCTCAFKKDLDTVPETAGLMSEPNSSENLSMSAKASLAASTASGSGATSSASSGKSPVRRRRANTTRSEGTLTFDEHGRHKPISQKHAKAVSQKSNPYPIHRINSARSTGGLSGFLLAATKDANEDDDLEEEDDQSSGNGGSESGAEDDGTSSLAAAAAAAAASNCGTFLPAQLSRQRRSRSETASPLLFANSFPQAQQLNGSSQLPPLNMGMVGYTSFSNYNAFSPEQSDQPLFSAGLSAPAIDWSQLGLDFDRGFSTSHDSDKFGAADSLGIGRNFAYDFNGSEQAPTMTTATSGEVSEAEDIMAPGLDDYDYEYDYDGATDAASSSVAFSRASSSYHLPAASGNVRSASSNDYNELRYLKSGNKFLPTPQGAAPDELSALAAAAGLPHTGGLDDDDAALWMPEYHGLPSMTESPESDVISFWGTK